MKRRAACSRTDDSYPRGSEVAVERAASGRSLAS